MREVAEPGDEADGRGTLGREDEADGADGRRGGREGDAGPGDEADGRRGGREARRAGDEADGRRSGRGRRDGRRTGGCWESLPFRTFFAVWVEIYKRLLQESLPFSANFPDLGRDFRTAATGISTLFGCFPLFG